MQLKYLQPLDLRVVDISPLELGNEFLPTALGQFVKALSQPAQLQRVLASKHFLGPFSFLSSTTLQV